MTVCVDNVEIKQDYDAVIVTPIENSDARLLGRVGLITRTLRKENNHVIFDVKTPNQESFVDNAPFSKSQVKVIDLVNI